MNKLSQIHIQITIQPNSVDVCKRFTEPFVNQPQCELLAHCSNPHCFKHGCLNILRQQAKGGVA